MQSGGGSRSRVIVVSGIQEQDCMTTKGETEAEHMQTAATHNGGNAPSSHAGTATIMAQRSQF